METRMRLTLSYLGEFVKLEREDPTIAERSRVLQLISGFIAQRRVLSHTGNAITENWRRPRRSGSRDQPAACNRGIWVYLFWKFQARILQDCYFQLQIHHSTTLPLFWMYENLMVDLKIAIDGDTGRTVWSSNHKHKFG